MKHTIRRMEVGGKLQAIKIDRKEWLKERIKKAGLWTRGMNKMTTKQLTSFLPSKHLREAKRMHTVSVS